MEEKKVTFEEKLTQLLELAKTKKNVLDNKEILNYFHGEILSPEQLDQIYDFLENHHVDVLRMDDDEDMEPELFEDGEEGGGGGGGGWTTWISASRMASASMIQSGCI